MFAVARASRYESAAVVVARRGKNAFAPSSSVRRRAISDARNGGSALVDMGEWEAMSSWPGQASSVWRPPSS
jgi:hypothetical protein